MDIPIPLPRTVFRTMGRDSAWNRIGIGVMDKRGVSVDHGEYLPATWSLIYVLRGRGIYQTSDGRQWPLEPGSCFQRIPGRVHSTHLVPDSGWVEAFLDLGPDLHRSLATMQVLAEEPPVWMWGLSGERIARFTDLIHDLAEAGEARLPALCVRLLGLAVEALPKSAADGNEDAVDRACRLLADQATTRLDLRSWCRRERLDYERFRKAFQRRLGVPPGQYHIRRRMDRACELLQTTDRSIAGIAAELGYPTAYEFSAQFRARMGLPPSHYRAR